MRSLGVVLVLLALCVSAIPVEGISMLVDDEAEVRYRMELEGLISALAVADLAVELLERGVPPEALLKSDRIKGVIYRGKAYGEPRSFSGEGVSLSPEALILSAPQATVVLSPASFRLATPERIALGVGNRRLTWSDRFRGVAYAELHSSFQRRLSAIKVVSSGVMSALGLGLFLVGTVSRRRRKEEGEVDCLTRAKTRYWLLKHREYLPNNYCVLLLDLDGFKAINDRYGHDAGDRVLRRFVQALVETLRKGDVVVRWGGDEFLLLLEDVSDYRTVRKVVRRLKEATREVIEFSVGYSFSSEKPGAPLEALVASADSRMYRHKRFRKNLLKRRSKGYEQGEGKAFGMVVAGD